MYAFSELEGKRVKLKPLEMEHSVHLYNCSRDPEIWANYPIHIRTIEEMNHFVQKAIEFRDNNESFPFVVFNKETNEIVGTTRYLRISEENNSAVREGILRKKFNNLDYVFYSIIDTEWNEIKIRLEGFLEEAGYVR